MKWTCPPMGVMSRMRGRVRRRRGMRWEARAEHRPAAVAAETAEAYGAIGMVAVEGATLAGL